jgi:phosphatidylserine decarboxylase
MKNIDSHPLLAKEGWLYIGISLVAAILTTAVFPLYIAFIFWIIAAFVLQFFRDPHRSIPSQDNAILSPADGKVIFTGIVDDPYLDRQAYKISVFMNVFSVHSNRAPIDGKIENIWYHEGSFLNAALDKASERNERNAIHIKTDKGDDVIFVQVAGLVARRILCYVDPGDSLEQGQRYGYIRFGSRVDLFLPADFKPAVSLGDQVKSGTSLLGEMA